MNKDIPQYQGPEWSGTGYLTVRASMGSEAFPLEGARVTVRGNEPNFSAVIVELMTGRDGLTPKISLATPPRILTESPQEIPPYATYNIEASLDGFYPVVAENVPVFDGITSVQPINFIPLSKNGKPDRFDPYGTIYKENEPYDL